MAIEVLRCPTCSANDNSPADAHGVHTCSYCGVRYRVTAGMVQTMTPSSPPQSRTLLAAGGALVAVGIIVAVVTTRGSESPSPVSATTAATPHAEATASAPPPAPAPTPAPTTPQPTETPAPMPVPVEVSPPTPPPVIEAPAVARFEYQSRRALYGTTFYAVGWVYNDSPFTIDKAKVTAVLLDAAGKEVGTAYGYSSDVIPAGTRQATEILVRDPPKFDKLAFEIVPSKARYIPPVAEGLRLEAGPVTKASIGSSYEVRGKVFNDGTKAARFVRVQALAFAADDTLLGIFYTYADGDSLAAGANARFNLNMIGAPANVARWSFTVDGSPLG